MTLGRYWGGHFPDVQRIAGRVYWDGHFPDGGVDPAPFGGYGPPGVATLVLDMDGSFTVRHQWRTFIRPYNLGGEQRLSRNDAPKQFYKGSAILTGNAPREQRARLARYAAIGSTFSLGLPHEELTLVADSSSSTVFVGSTALVDWAKPGQRALIVGVDDSSLPVIVQDKTSTTILLNVTPGTTGKAGGRIMPTMPIMLDPQQGDERYPVNAEVWQLSARAAIFDFAPTLASLPLAPITASSALDNVVLRSRVFGLSGNFVTVTFVEDAGAPAAGDLAEIGGVVTLTFRGGVTTLDQINALFNTSSWVKMTGTWTGSATLASGTGDEFSAQPLTGGVDTGDMGTGATLTTYDGRPVWDRAIQVDETGPDSIHALTEILDAGGVPYSIGSRDQPEWGRHVMLRRDDHAEWQWFKLFTKTVRGRQRAWWLPTHRDDFTFVSKSTNTITVSTTDGSDFFAWWPTQRDRIQIEQTDGTITRAKITAGVDNHDGTLTMTIGVTISATAVSRVCWLELCRFESDDFDVTFAGPSFAMQTLGRVVRA